MHFYNGKIRNVPFPISCSPQFDSTARKKYFAVQINLHFNENCDCPWSNINILGKKEFATIYVLSCPCTKNEYCGENYGKMKEHSFTSSYQQVGIGCLVEIGGVGVHVIP